MKTFIRWPGNKQKHLKYIIPYLPNTIDRYIEPFLGSGALLLNLQPSIWIANDLNSDIINIWQTVYREPLFLINKFKHFNKQLILLSNEDKLLECKAKTKAIINLKMNRIRAAWFILMIYCAFLGQIIRDNKYAFGSLEATIYHNKSLHCASSKYAANLLEINKFMSSTKWKLYNTDYKKIISKAKFGDFVFLDPPYKENKDYQFNYHLNEKKNANFNEELLNEVLLLDEKGVKWMMTQADTPEVRKLFNKYDIKSFAIYRLALKSYKNELIIRNYTN
jgi:DNA adenine methylase